MSKKPAESSSSTSSESFHDPKDAARLAEVIVASLRDARRHRNADLLSVWVAENVADLMVELDADPSPVSAAALSETVSLILLLWQNRSHWPHGWPPEAAEARIAQLTPPDNSWEPSSPTTGNAWIDRAGELWRLAAEEAILCWQVGLLETGVDEQRAAVQAAPDSSEDSPDIRWLTREIEMYDEAKTWAKASKARTRAEVRQTADTALRAIAERRTALVSELVTSVAPRRRPKRSTPPEK